MAILAMFFLATSSMSQKAPTFDEQGFIVRGLAYWRGYDHMRVGHPLGLNLLNSALLASDDAVLLPVDDPSWTGTSFHRPAELFLWEAGNDVAHVMFLARFPSIWLGVLLAAVAGRWAWKLSRQRWIGLLALVFLALDPNVLAHTRLATTDLGLTFFALLAAMALWRFLLRPGWATALVAGGAGGLLLNTKFNGALFFPLFAVLVLLGLVRRWSARQGESGAGATTHYAAPRARRILLMLLVAYPLAAIMVLWTSSAFDVGRLPDGLPLVSGLTVPLANYVDQALDLGGRLQVTTPSFLLGKYSESGWWYYFPVVFLLKTPVPTLVLIVVGSTVYLRTLWRTRGRGLVPDGLATAALLLPALGFLAIALTSTINLGYRHILPALPFLVVFGATSLQGLAGRVRERRRVVFGVVLAIWLAVATLLIYPDFLAFFNLLAGGPDNGWRSLVDSNLDWGQDLDELPEWMAANDVSKVWLSYFGEGRPEYYGIDYRGLDSFPPRLMNPQARPFYPTEPAPGVYAISATNLQGVHFADHDQYAWFRVRAPLDKLGYSIFLYDVPAHGAPVALLLDGLQIDEVSPADYALLGTNDVRPRWVDLEESLILPAGERVWLAQADGASTHPLLQPLLQPRLWLAVEAEGYSLYQYDAPERPGAVQARWRFEESAVDLNAAEIVATAENGLAVQSTWTQQGTPRELKIFIHVTGPDGRLVTQWDGLGVPWEGWQPGDALIQLHHLEWPEILPSGTYKLSTGIYDPQSGQRWRTEGGLDSLEIGQLTLP